MILRSLAVTLTRLPRDLKPGLRKSSLPSAEQKGWLFGFSSLASRVLHAVFCMSYKTDAVQLNLQ
jgi:hypothetical protein